MMMFLNLIITTGTFMCMFSNIGPMSVIQLEAAMVLHFIAASSRITEIGAILEKFYTKMHVVR